jgi:polygalacturonase
MDRRGFLGSMLAACAAPAIVRADSLMRVIPISTIVIPAKTIMGMVNVRDFGAIGDGVTDDTKSIQAAMQYANRYGGRVYFPAGAFTFSGEL